MAVAVRLGVVVVVVLMVVVAASLVVVQQTFRKIVRHCILDFAHGKNEIQ